MKILLLASAGSIHSIRWANAFAENGHHVTLVSENGNVRKDDLIESVQLHYLKYSGRIGYVLNAAELRRFWTRLKPDVVNVHYASGYGTLARLARIRPLVLSVWGSDVYDFPEKNWFSYRMVKKNISFADAIASTSHAMAEQVRRLMHDPEMKITVTPFGVDITKFSPAANDTSYQSDQFIFGTIKKLDYKYGIDYLIKAFGLFIEKWKVTGQNGRSPHLFICGKGCRKEEFERLRDELGLKDYITIEGYHPNNEVPDLLRNIDVFCLSSNSESFGVSAVEALACARPVIATDVDGFKEIIVNGESGMIVPRRSAEALAEKMWELYNNENLRIQLGKAGRKRVLERFNWTDNVSVLENLLVSVSNKHN